MAVVVTLHTHADDRESEAHMSLESKPWARKAFELLFHAEAHLRVGEDYDKRLALISFDNSIEVSIHTYLDLHHNQRGGKKYKEEDVKVWLGGTFHPKVEFFIGEIKRRGLPERMGKEHIGWLHDQRNEIYHGSSGGVPEKKTLNEIRDAALWVFSVLFDITDIESLLSEALKASEKPESAIPQDFAKPKLSDLTLPIFDPQKASALAIASLIGKWDEANPADMEIVRRLANGF